MASAHRHKRILVSWYTTPRYIPPFQLSDRQTTVGPQTEPDQDPLMFAGWTPPGEYDLFAALQSQKIGTKFDALVVWSDASATNRPLNLEAFDCPKVLCVGDTQHLNRPLSGLIAYAQQAKFDVIVSSHNRHHLHWFGAAGFDKLAWIPGLKARHMPRPIKDGRTPQIAFVGQSGGFHPRRQRLLEALQAGGIPLVARQATREASADLYAASVASFNASLNGDLNLRIFEILSAGGCLLTDRLAPQSGLDFILREDQDFCAYDSPEELADKARFLLREPAAALALARAGNRTYVRNLLPERQAEVLLGWVFDGRIDAPYAMESRQTDPDRAVPLKTRLAVYEALQELHRRAERPRVLLSPDLPSIFRDDAADLHRLAITVGTDDGQRWDAAVVRKTTPAFVQTPPLLISL